MNKRMVQGLVSPRKRPSAKAGIRQGDGFKKVEETVPQTLYRAHQNPDFMDRSFEEEKLWWQVVVYDLWVFHFLISSLNNLFCYIFVSIWASIVLLLAARWVYEVLLWNKIDLLGVWYWWCLIMNKGLVVELFIWQSCFYERSLINFITQQCSELNCIRFIEFFWLVYDSWFDSFSNIGSNKVYASLLVSVDIGEWS